MKLAGSSGASVFSLPGDATPALRNSTRLAQAYDLSGWWPPEAAVRRVGGRAALSTSDGGGLGVATILLLVIGIAICAWAALSFCLHSNAQDDSEDSESEVAKKKRRRLPKSSRQADDEEAEYESEAERAPRGGATDNSSESEGEEAKNLFEEDTIGQKKADMVESMGISGLCLVSTQDDMRTVVLIAFQAFFLQAMILYYIAGTLVPQPDLSKSLPIIIVVAAIYLHFVSCVADLPLSVTVLRQFNSIHDTSAETYVYGVIFFVDGVVVPLAQLIIGAFFLCTSMTVADVIMNSCAVTYISNIDNMILAVNKALNSLALKDKDFSEDDELQLIVPTHIMDLINWTWVIVPVIPGAFSAVVAYIGLNVMHL